MPTILGEFASALPRGTAGPPQSIPDPLRAAQRPRKCRRAPRKRSGKGLLHKKDHRGQCELSLPVEATHSWVMRNTGASGQMSETGRWSEPWIRILLRGSGSPAETNFDATRQRPSIYWRPFPPALPRATRPGCSQKPGVEKSSHNVSYAKLQLRQVLFFCHRLSERREVSRLPAASVASSL